MVYVLIPAAGQGKRMGAGKNKVLLPLLHQPVLAWTLAAMETATRLQGVVLIGQEEDRDPFLTIARQVGMTKPVHFVIGGTTRQESVWAGVQCLQRQGWVGGVLVHDGARCLITPSLLDTCAQALQAGSGLIAAVPVKDTIKVAKPFLQGNGQQAWQVADTPDRQTLWAAQTPQGSLLPEMVNAHETAQQQGWDLTDDAALLEKIGIPVRLIPGEETNLKLTTPHDLDVAAAILRQRGMG